MAENPRRGRLKRWTIAVLAAVILAVSAYAAVELESARGPEAEPTPTPTLPAFIASGGQKGCTDVETCEDASILTNVGFSEYVLAVAVYGTSAPSAVVITHMTNPLTLQESYTTSSPAIYVYAGQQRVQDPPTMSAFVNFSSDTYYDFGFAGTSGGIMNATFVSGLGTGHGSSGTKTFCNITTSVNGELDITEMAALGTETYTLGESQQSIASAATTTDILEGENAYLDQASSGSEQLTATFGTSEAWSTACIGLLPSVDANPPISFDAGAPTTTTIPVYWSIFPAEQPWLTEGIINEASYSGGSCGSYSNFATLTGSSIQASDGTTVTGLTEGSSYCLEMEVENTTGASGFATWDVLTDVTTAYAPGQVTGLTASPVYASATELDLGWINGAGHPWNTNESIWTSVGSSCSAVGARWTNVPSNLTISYLVTGLAPSTEYSFEVAGYGYGGGGLGAWSSCVSATTYDPPSQTYGLNVVGTSSSTITIAWNDPPGVVVNATVYIGVPSLAPVPFCTEVTQVSAGDVYEYTASGLASGATYCFAVSVWSSNGLNSSLEGYLNATVGGGSGAGGGASGTLGGGDFLSTNPQETIDSIFAVLAVLGIALAIWLDRRRR